MFAVKPLSSLKSDLSGASFRRPPSLPGLGAKIRRTQRPKENGGGSIRAVISSGDPVVETEKSPAVEGNGSPPYSSSNNNTVDLKVVLTVRKKIRQRLSDKIEAQFESLINGIGRGISLQLVGEEIDPDTQSGKMAESAVKGWLPQQPEQPYIVEYAADFTVAKDFGPVGAVLVTNLNGKEFYLVEIVINGFNQGPIYFPAHTWIHAQKHNRESRIIFRNQVYLPSQTPPGLKDLRREDLASIRGDGQGERKAHERIYDYAPYNDLGNPDKGEELVRPVLGTEEKPYPRRCRTGRPPMRTDKRCESRIEKPHPVYVPRDETFEEIKQATFAAGRLKALLHNLVPLISSSISTSEVSFKCFSEIDRLYTDGLVLSNENDQNNNGPILPSVFKEFLTEGTRLMKYKIPAIISRDRFAWLRDNEFARQALAGLNPVSIELLKEFPIMSKLDPAVYGPPESALTKEVLEKELDGMSVEEAIEEKRLFIIDYHDMILPFAEKINSIPNRKVYASRTIFFYNRTGFLRPIAIELTLPPTYTSPQNKRVITHGKSNTSHWTWKLAKAHVCSVDAGVHQLVNHWLRTHASMEPYIIATHRQLSAIHPIYKLLRPHMRYTLEINALARQSLINGGGVIEACFSPGKYAMELSSAAYKSKWRFDMEALPADLIRRGVAVEDPTAPHGLRLLIEDYPYAADGLLVWSATKEWVESYVDHFYSEPGSIASDVELHGWWDEIKNKGHYDKRNEPWWPQLNTKEDLTNILTTIIWTGSGQHAAINFGQYPFGGYMPNRPTLMRRLIPEEGTTEYDTFIMNPQLTFLLSLPTQVQATKVMAVQETLSTHSGDEEYLGQVNPMQKHWIDDREVVQLFEKFSDKLMEIEKIIHERNRDLNLSNRSGAGVPPYELLLPSSGPGVTGRGIPNSISI